MSIIFPNIDPVLLHIGPLAIRWYSLSYIFGILIGWWGFSKTSRHLQIKDKDLDAILSYVILGVIIGARLGNVLFYDLITYLEDPISIFKLWEGGMSFHGGVLGVVIALFIYCKKYHLPFLPVLDLAACFAPIGLFLGRIANFINGELWGKVTDMPWGVIFPYAGPLPRHPSQIYEAILEGLLLFIFMMLILFKSKAKEYPGMMSGLMAIWYSCARIIVEFFREPYVYSIYLYIGITVGQILSLVMLLAGIILVMHSRRIKSSKSL